VEKIDRTQNRIYYTHPRINRLYSTGALLLNLSRPGSIRSVEETPARIHPSMICQIFISYSRTGHLIKS